ncbi:MAG: SGNH/GDSL hydrolase family protein [Microbacteriaceae bacterium]|nr:SGNH/GDSL hydrolase family protein [Microbacteriaceae bacterium]
MNRILLASVAVAVLGLSSIITVVALAATAEPRSATTHLPIASSASATPSAAPATPSTAPAAPSVAPAPVAAASPKKVLMIGDSIMKGYGLTPGAAWPELISATNGWDLTSLACDGAGFLAPGSPDECGNTFVDVSRTAASHTPDLIIIEGSSNDFGQPNPQLLSATVTALTILRSEFPNAEIIGLSTVWSDTEPPAQLADINSQVEQAVIAVGGRYLDIGQPFGAHPELLQGDDVHPTVAGQVALAAAIQTAITAK